jgi:hypothetical protein
MRLSKSGDARHALRQEKRGSKLLELLFFFIILLYTLFFINALCVTRLILLISFNITYCVANAAAAKRLPLHFVSLRHKRRFLRASPLFDFCMVLSIV